MTENYAEETFIKNRKIPQTVSGGESSYTPKIAPTWNSK